MLQYPCVTGMLTRNVSFKITLPVGMTRSLSTASKSIERPLKASLKFKNRSSSAVGYSEKPRKKSAYKPVSELKKNKSKASKKSSSPSSGAPTPALKADFKECTSNSPDSESIPPPDMLHLKNRLRKILTKNTPNSKPMQRKAISRGNLHDSSNRALNTLNRTATHLTHASRTLNSPEDTIVPHSNLLDSAPLAGSVAEFVAPKTNSIKQLKPLDKHRIPRLAHNLDRTLFSPGVHYYQDPRTRVYNFPPFLKNIIRYQDFDFDSIATFKTVSRDELLLEACLKHKKRFYSSTSSMTSTLTQFYMLLNNYTSTPDRTRFGFRFGGLVNSLPSSLFLVPKKSNASGKTIYAIESDKSADYEILLSAMGHCLEALLTTEESEFDQYRKGSSRKQRREEIANTYNYASIGDFVMRSQLDCFDERLPGNGTFDLKTRAALTVRHSARNPNVENNHYQIWKQNGQFESFEREVDDMIRTGAMLKYAFQARIGQMDGIYVAFHNVNTFFGFQYLPLSHLDEIFYGHKNLNDPIASIPSGGQLDSLAKIDLDAMPEKLPTFVAESQFAILMHMWQDLLHKIVEPKLAMKTHGGPYRIVIKSEDAPENGKVRVCAYAHAISTLDMQKLQKFSSRFKTSFREPITDEKRSANLSLHRAELMNFNREISRKGDIACFHIEVDEHRFDGVPETKSCAYPLSVGAEWKVKYTIRESEEDSSQIRARFVSLNQISCDALVQQTNASLKIKDGPPSRAQEREMYQHLGSARRSRWKHKDDNPVVYQPSF